MSTSTILPEPYYLQVAKGQVPGTTSVNIFGYSNNVGTPPPETLWEKTGVQTWAFPSSASVLTLVSSSASDNTACTVLITGLDANWNLVTEVKALNGTSSVTTTNAFLRINSMIVVTPGTGQTSNVGNITATNGGATVYAQISAGVSRTQHSAYSVANGYSFYITNINALSGDANGSAYVTYRAVTTDNSIATPITRTVLQTTFQLNYNITRVNPFKYPSKTDVQWQFAVNTGTHAVSAILEGILTAG